MHGKTLPLHLLAGMVPPCCFDTHLSVQAFNLLVEFYLLSLGCVAEVICLKLYWFYTSLHWFLSSSIQPSCRIFPRKVSCSLPWSSMLKIILVKCLYADADLIWFVFFKHVKNLQLTCVLTSMDVTLYFVCCLLFLKAWFLELLFRIVVFFFLKMR